MYSVLRFDFSSWIRSRTDEPIMGLAAFGEDPGDLAIFVPSFGHPRRAWRPVEEFASASGDTSLTPSAKSAFSIWL